MLNTPMMLTFLRFGLIPLVVIFYYIPSVWGRALAAILFIIAAITDGLDGYLARNRGQTTKFGAFLDPVADKLLVAVALVVLVDQLHLSIALSIPAIIIISREILVSALREWMAEIGKRSSINVVTVGKYKAILQMGGIAVLLFYHDALSGWFFWAGMATLYIAALLTLWSMVIYLKLAWSDLTREEESQ